VIRPGRAKADKAMRGEYAEGERTEQREEKRRGEVSYGEGLLDATGFQTKGVSGDRVGVARLTGGGYTNSSRNLFGGGRGGRKVAVPAKGTYKNQAQ